uniref:Uncharacterized protein n=1 Tax=Helianthus annuus TaxID=4232 RepID=A0A251TNT0_HELAN
MIKLLLLDHITFICVFEINTFVALIYFETVVNHDMIKLLVPLFWCLLQAIQRLDEFTYFTLLTWGGETFRLLHVNLFF